ncbi:hypothetical protein [Halobacterium jilantaiense]|uniref:Uncharacterized protein n=1 Tax=Halobacterium jilantaiense TaxID=355548 RepID=A0A1I0R3E9_9EURY|nr:hypothetical protein [Halobacterium jilantaiense]SEW34782.1 hypothetical protein SAMN04487945_3073 [Halobacterium jilantaiense]
MPETPTTNQTNTRRYLILGTISAIISVVLIPVAGLVSVYSSYKIHGRVRKLYTYIMGGVGAASVLLWITYLTTL